MTAYNSGTKGHTKMIFGYDIGRALGKNLVRSDFGYHPWGQPQA